MQRRVRRTFRAACAVAALVGTIAYGDVTVDNHQVGRAWGGDPVAVHVVVPDSSAEAAPGPLLYVVAGAPDAHGLDLDRLTADVAGSARIRVAVVRLPAVAEDPADRSLGGLLTRIETEIPALAAVPARGVIAVGKIGETVLRSARSGNSPLRSVSWWVAGGATAARVTDPVVEGDSEFPWILVDATGTPHPDRALETLRASLVRSRVPHLFRTVPPDGSLCDLAHRFEAHVNFHRAALASFCPDMERWTRFWYERIGVFIRENLVLAVDIPSKPTICLLGSSSVQGFSSERMPGYRVFNRGIVSDRLGIGPRGISHRLGCSAFDMRPDHVFIKNGRNDLAAAYRSGVPSIDRMVEEYGAILGALRACLPQARLYVVTCAPVRDGYAHLAESVAECNRRLAALAASTGVAVVDLHAALIGADGLLREEYSRDGLHVSSAAQEVWAALMMRAIEEGDASDP